MRRRQGDRARARVGVITIELSIPGAVTGREKRSRLRPVIEGIRRRFECSVAEIGSLYSRDAAVIAAAVVGRDVALLDRTMAAIAEEAQKHEVRLEDFETEVI